MNDATYNPMNCPHFDKHETKTNLEVLLKEDDATYLSGNSCAVKARYYGCGRSIVTLKEYIDKCMKEHNKEKYCVALTRDKPVFTCVKHRKKTEHLSCFFVF